MHKVEKYGFTKTRFYIFVQLVCFLFLLTEAKAQVMTIDTTAAKPKDTVVLKKTAVLHSPRKAAIYSAILPGLGQAYNKKYWKIPVIYAVAGALTYFVISNQRDYMTYRTAYRLRVDGDSATIDQFANQYNESSLLNATQQTHRFRDLSIFGVTLVYLLNIVDASVDAHLFTFDVSYDLSLKFQPALIQTVGINTPKNTITGISLHLTF